MRLTVQANPIRFDPPVERVTVAGRFISYVHTPDPRTMGRKKLARKADLKTAPMPSWRILLPVWGVLVACVWIAFSAVLSNGFVDLDDPDWILENHSIRGLGWEQIQFAFTTFKGGVYQPLGWLLQSFVYSCYGLNPHGYHLVSLLFHVVNVILLHRLCVGLLARTIPDTTRRLGAASPGSAAFRCSCMRFTRSESRWSRGHLPRPTCRASPSRSWRPWPTSRPTRRAGFAAVRG